MNAAKTCMEVLEADITTLALDAIVNAANSALMPGGGVDGAVRRKAGREIDEELYAIGHCNEGEAVITRGYRLPARHVIHTVAPVWNAGENQKSVLARCYENALRLADVHQIRSIAFPSIGTGAFGWPADLAAGIAFGAVAAHVRKCAMQTRIVFCCFSRADRERYTALIGDIVPPFA
jgi:O-acetyl-ADP-ribose deacetylase (regulator of RNase III)